MKAAVCRAFGKPLVIEEVDIAPPQAGELRVQLKAWAGSAAESNQLATCSPNFLLLEGIETWGGFHAEILKTPIQWVDGYVIPPTAAGLGVELNEQVAARHQYHGTELHQVPVLGSAEH